MIAIDSILVPDCCSYENDIGIIKLQRATIFNSYIWPICMPPLDTNWQNGVVIGEYDGELMENLN